MATQSYPRSTPVDAPPTLEMRWMAEGGRLRSRWSIVMQLKQLKPVWLARACSRQSMSERIVRLRVDSSRVIHVLCSLLVLLF
jgi:hypothetical protein